MITSSDFKRLLLDALAHGDDYDGFRTHLRAKLKEIDAEDVVSPNARDRLAQSMQKLTPCKLSPFGTA